jgi:hypothetical protein
MGFGPGARNEAAGGELRKLLEARCCSSPADLCQQKVKAVARDGVGLSGMLQCLSSKAVGRSENSRQNGSPSLLLKFASDLRVRLRSGSDKGHNLLVDGLRPSLDWVLMIVRMSRTDESACSGGTILASAGMSALRASFGPGVWR